MFIGGAVWDSGYRPEQEELLFYRGYGAVEIDQVAIAYYRYERIIEDIAVECWQILSSGGRGPDRVQAFEFLKSNFGPGGAAGRARRLDRTV